MLALRGANQHFKALCLVFVFHERQQAFLCKVAGRQLQRRAKGKEELKMDCKQTPGTGPFLLRVSLQGEWALK
jgi:hypothetical protein